MDLAGTLKDSIGDLHRQIESTPYARAIFAGTISPEDYARSLVQFLQMHESLEGQLAIHPGLPCYDPASMARAESLRRDIAWWGGSMDDDLLPATKALASTFGEWSRTTPLALLGALYVLEGSRMGSMILAGSLSRGLGVPAAPGMGLDYHVDGISQRPMNWRAFRETLNSLTLSPDESEGVVSAAVTTMSILGQLYANLRASAVRQDLEVLA